MNDCALVVDPNPADAAAISAVLEACQLQPVVASSGAAAEALLREFDPVLIVLELILGDMDGLILCANLAGRLNVPIIICSGTIRKRDAVLARKLGADDFVSKPFEPDDFQSRVEAILRRSARVTGWAATSGETTNVLRMGSLAVDDARHTVTLGGEPLNLTPTEYQLALYFLNAPDRVLPRAELSKQLWGYSDEHSGRTLDVHIRRLRKKLTGANVPEILTVRAFGYKMTLEAALSLTGADR